MSYFDFAHLCALASLREITSWYKTARAKAQSRQEKPQSKTLLKIYLEVIDKLKFV